MSTYVIGSLVRWVIVIAEANDADLTVTLLADLVPTFHHQVLTEKAANGDKKPEEAVSVPAQG